MIRDPRAARSTGMDVSYHQRGVDRPAPVGTVRTEQEPAADLVDRVDQHPGLVRPLQPRLIPRPRPVARVTARSHEPRPGATISQVNAWYGGVLRHASSSMRRASDSMRPDRCARSGRCSWRGPGPGGAWWVGQFRSAAVVGARPSAAEVIGW